MSKPEIYYTKPNSYPNDLFTLISKGKISSLHEAFQQMTSSEIAYQLSRQDHEGKTLIHYSCYLDLELISLYLISLGSNLSNVDRNGQSCIHVLAFKGNYKSLNVILNYELHQLRRQLYDTMNAMKKEFGMGNINLANTASWILTSSIDSDLKIKAKKIKFSVELIQKLRDYFSQVVQIYSSALNQIDLRGRNPLHYAALSKFTWCHKVVESLLSPHKVENFSEFLLNFDNLERLKNSLCKIDPKKYLNILNEVKSIIGISEYKICYKEFKDALKSTIESAINAKDNNDKTPLKIATISGDFKIVTKLVDLKAEKPSEDSQTLANLKSASSKLVEKYLSLPEPRVITDNIDSYNGLISFGYIPQKPKRKIISENLNQKVLTERDALPAAIINQKDPNLIEWDLYTPLHYACMLGKLEDVIELISQGADVNAVSQYLQTPLHLAAQFNKSNTIKVLIDNGAAKDQKDQKNRTPLMLAAKFGAIDSLKSLLGNGADPYEIDDRNWTCLHYASFHNKEKIIAELIRWDIDENKLHLIKNSQGKTALEFTSNQKTKDAFDTLWVAAFKGDLDLARKLVRKGHDINERTLFERTTPLMNAVKNSQVMMVKVLLDHGADKDITDKYQQTALDYAKEVEHPQIIMMLEA